MKTPTSRSSRKTHGLVTAQDVADSAGVSVTTVSRCFGESERVSKRTRERIVSTANKLGYSPNIAARVLASRRSRLIGLMVDDFKDPDNLDIFRFCTAQAQEKNYQATLLNTYRENSKIGFGSVENAMLQQVDGLLVSASYLSQEMIDRCAAQDKRVVILGRKSGDPTFSSVYCDNERGAAQVADYFMKKGVKRPAFIGGNPLATVTAERRTGFINRIEKLYGIQPIVREVGSDYDNAFNIAKDLSVLPKPPDGYFCASDLLAVGIVDGLDSKKIEGNGGEQPVIVGFGHSMLSRLSRYQLASVELPIEEMVRAATTHLIDTITDNNDGPQKIVFPCAFEH